MEKFRFRPCCRFFSILYLRNGQFQFYITKLFLKCDDHARLFTESCTISDPSSAASLCSKHSCLKFLRCLSCENLSSQTVKGLGAVIGNCKHFSCIKVGEVDDSICYLLEQVPHPSKSSLKIAHSAFVHSMIDVFGPPPYVDVHLTSVVTVKLASLLPRFNNVIVPSLNLRDCCAGALETLVTSIPHKTLEKLILLRISLTPAATKRLGRSLPEMSSLQELEITGVDGSVLQAEEMEALFGGLSETMPLFKLTFSGFNVRGCLAPLINSFRIFPNLSELRLENPNIDEHDQCDLLKCPGSLRRLEVCVNDKTCLDSLQKSTYSRHYGWV